MQFNTYLAIEKEQTQDKSQENQPSRTGEQTLKYRQDPESDKILKRI